MFQDVQLICTGTAAVIVTVLLFALLDRRNWPYVMLPLVGLVGGAWLWYGGLFVHRFAGDSSGVWAARVHIASMMTMALGLLAMPSALLHMIARLWRTGLTIRPPINVRYTFAYLPLLLIIPIASWIINDPEGPFFELVSPLVLPYLLWFTLVGIVAGIGFWRLRSVDLPPRIRQFYTWMSILLLALSMLHSLAYMIAPDAWRRSENVLQLCVMMAPVIPALVFAYFVIRHNFMQLVIERTIVYGAIIVGGMLFHSVVVQDLTANLSDKYKINFGIIEGVAMIAVILTYQPLRSRVAEALRYLMGSRVAGVRNCTRNMAVQMSGLAGQPPGDLLKWFVEAVGQAVEVKYVSAWLFDASGDITLHAGDSGGMDQAHVLAMHQNLSSSDQAFFTHRDAPDRRTLECLQQSDASLAVALNHQNVRGVIFLGRKSRNRLLGEEEIGLVVLLVEQLGITLNNSLLQAERLAAERRALQNEKLLTLGLLASSIAHEVKNPLSSIKTIITVLAEQLGQQSEHAEDLRHILAEIDRLATTTSELLQFARPGNSTASHASVHDVLQGTLRIMGHLAKKLNVSIETDIEENLPPVRTDENSLREIFVNLLSNALEAASARDDHDAGRLTISSHCQKGVVVTEFRDNGPGIPPQVQDQLFEPFVTTKQEGTGLGLYVVGRRVRESGGEVRCESAPGEGTTIIVKLPIETKDMDCQKEDGSLKDEA